MRHNVFGRQLSRDTGQRLALLKGLAGALIRSESIETTEAKAKAAKTLIEKLITQAKRGTVHDIRQVESVLNNKDLVFKLVHQIAPRFASIKGGYLRLIKLGTRQGDNASMVRIELTANSAPAPVAATPKPVPAAAAAKTPAKPKSKPAAKKTASSSKK